MKKIILFVALLSVQFITNAQNINLTLRSQIDYANPCSNIWGYVDDFGNEYALLGTWEGVSIINVTNPDTPVVVADIPSVISLYPGIVWREIKTFNHHAYVTNEQDSGLLIIDLTNLPNSNLSYHHFSAQGLKTAHTDWVDENGILYLFGFNTYTGIPNYQRGAMMFDLNVDPDNPQYIAQYNGAYIHDGFVRGDTLWASEVYQGKLVVLDVSNPSNFQQLAEVTTPLAFTHNAWPTHDNHYVFTTDEVTNSALTSYDVNDLANITELDQAQSNPGSGSIIHNVHLKNDDFATASYYRDGVVIFDVSQPDNIIEVGNYDTSPLTGNGFNGDWGVYPFLPSENLLLSDMEGGLFVLSPHYQKACRLQGTVTDTFSNALLSNVQVEFIPAAQTEVTDFAGVYQTGILNQGLYTLQFSLPGYITKVINNIQFDSAVTNILDVQLVPSTPIDATVTVIDSATSAPIPYAQVFITDHDQYSYSVIADTNGVATFSQIYPSSYDVYAGKWEHQTRMISSPLNQGLNALSVAIPSGYYDDFIFDFGWTSSGTASTGLWERGIPVMTTNNSDTCNAGADVTNDLGDDCYVTGNGGGSAGDDDVDNGYVLLTSPVFDLSNYINPIVSYERWFYNGGGSGTPNDSLSIYISNGDSTKKVEFATHTSQLSQWIYHQFLVTDFVALSSNMQLIVRTADQASSGHLVEGGFDFFRVKDTSEIVNSIATITGEENLISVFPNPVSAGQFLQLVVPNSANGKIILTDICGKTISEFNVPADRKIFLPKNISQGMYFLKYLNGNQISVCRLVVE